LIDIDRKMPFQSFSKRFLSEKFVLQLTAADIVAGVAATTLSVWHYQTRHFVSNNILGAAFAVQGVEHIAIGTYRNGAIMLVRRGVRLNTCGRICSEGETPAHLRCLHCVCFVQTGLFFYDIFWVFGTDVMVTVARSFDAPIKLLFLRSHATEDEAAQFSMLGLGDIVIPGSLALHVSSFPFLFLPPPPSRYRVAPHATS